MTATCSRQVHYPFSHNHIHETLYQFIFLTDKTASLVSWLVSALKIFSSFISFWCCHHRWERWQLGKKNMVAINKMNKTLHKYEFFIMWLGFLADATLMTDIAAIAHCEKYPFFLHLLPGCGRKYKTTQQVLIATVITSRRRRASLLLKHTLSRGQDVCFEWGKFFLFMRHIKLKKITVEVPKKNKQKQLHQLFIH